MELVYLKSRGARAEIMPRRGALISSLKFDGSDADALWMPKTFDSTASSWPGGGIPFLFPFAGRVWHKGEIYKYGLDDSVYNMPLHGFSWATDWSVGDQTTDQVTLSLSSDDVSRGLYPFEFEIIKKIKLTDHELLINVTINHKKPLSASPKMPVAAGWHPYLALASSDNTVKISAKTIYPVTPQGGAGKPIPASDHLGQTPWSLPKQELQSLILSDLAGDPSVLTRGHLPALTIKAGPSNLMRHIVTWTNEPSMFHCVEPWMSLPDAVATPTGCEWLAGGESLELWFSINS